MTKPRHFQRLYTLEELVRDVINHLKDAKATFEAGNASTAEEMYSATQYLMGQGDMAALWTYVDHQWPTDLGPELTEMVKEVNKLHEELGDALRATQ